MAARHYLQIVMAIMVATMMFVTACSKGREGATHHPDQAFLDSQIPPGLPPQYFPPAGFVWAGFKSGNLPEARYGVAAPPTNPRAEIVIIADAAFPAEAYFNLARDLISFNYTVWIFEAPGQGGSGRYFLQGDKIHTPDFNHGVQSVQDFISTVVRPMSDRPVYIIGTGTGALTALSINTKATKFGGIVIYSPYLSPQQPAPMIWRGEDVPSDEWAQTGHKWQRANPDLRLRAASETWQSEMDTAAKDLTTPGLKRLSFDRDTTRRLIVVEAHARHTPLNKLEQLCENTKTCRIKRLSQTKGLGAEIDQFVNQSAPAATPS